MKFLTLGLLFAVLGMSGSDNNFVHTENTLCSSSGSEILAAAEEPCQVNVGPETELKKYKHYDETRAASKSGIVTAVFSSKRPLKNFALYWIEFKDMDKNDKPVFTARKIVSHSIFYPDRPLLAEMRFLGSMPNYAVSYIDNAGRKRYFSVEQSGMDGSINIGGEVTIVP